MPVHVQGFIHTTLRFPSKCRLIQKSVDRPNICYLVREITWPSKSFEGLFPLIPPDVRCSSEIVKTMVFLETLGGFLLFRIQYSLAADTVAKCIR